MAKIPLRAYNREIEAMIDRGESNTAIAHCRHILKYYPKHIDTYRLLGKAYLESQRYAEAADVLQRILSAVPDDFISQIGMSIIREDEGNLDAAIWHMEKAFEAQPSNTAVQDELRRLYGRRDGVEPPKIRLTRGALVRMYARGELYQQAIAEIRAALAEDPLRVDLEVILARMYFLSGQTVAAIEVCSRLISKLPYCFEANRILAETLLQTSRAEDAKIYQQRVFAMDPYLAYLPPNAISSIEVPDNAVTLDRLEIENIEEETTSPEWALTAGVEFKTESEEPLPDWFSEIKPAEAAQDSITSSPLTSEATTWVEEQSPESSAPIITDQPEEETIPEWMREAGWTPADKVDETVEAGFNLPEEGLEMGEIPEWLQEIAPEESLSEEQPADEEENDWLEKILPSEETKLSEGTPLTPFTDEIQLSEEQSTAEEIEQTAIDESAISFSTSTTDKEEVGIAATFEDEPEWLKDLTTLEEEQLPAESEPFPAEIPSFSETELETAAEEKLTSPIAPEPGTSQTLPDLEDLDATMAWLESLAARQGADESTLLTSPEERQDTPPEWIQSLVEETPAEIAPEFEEKGIPTPQPEIPPSDMPQNEEVEQSGQAAIPDFMQIEQAESPETAELQQPQTPETEEPLPDWLMESLQEGEATAETPEETEEFTLSTKTGEEGAVMPPFLTSPPKELEDEDSTFAWLESLAAKQGAAEETLLTKPEDRQEELPEWVKEELQSEENINTIADNETVAEVEITQPGVEFFEQQPETIEDTQPVYHKAAAPPAVEEEVESLGISGEETPSIEAETPTWLKGLEEQEPETEQEEMPSDWVPEFELPTAEVPSLEIEEPQPPAATIEAGSHAELLTIAQSALQSHNLEKALQAYNQLIKDGQYLEETIHDLRDALYRYPIDITIWQTLGDAYLRSNRLQEALEAYTKAEELLR
jgi:tetratricopeptide (TPR) repeat protein